MRRFWAHSALQLREGDLENHCFFVARHLVHSGLKQYPLGGFVVGGGVGSGTACTVALRDRQRAQHSFCCEAFAAHAGNQPKAKLHETICIGRAKEADASDCGSVVDAAHDVGAEGCRVALLFDNAQEHAHDVEFIFEGVAALPAILLTGGAGEHALSLLNREGVQYETFGECVHALHSATLC